VASTPSLAIARPPYSSPEHARLDGCAFGILIFEPGEERLPGEQIGSAFLPKSSEQKLIPFINHLSPKSHAILNRQVSRTRRRQFRRRYQL